MIRSEAAGRAAPSTVHELLIDVETWRIWAPHVASVDADQRILDHGWVGETRAFFAPSATTMFVDEVRPSGGYRWHSLLGPWRLDYDNAVMADGAGCTVRFTAELHGPGAAVLERLVAPLSARSQRRRIQRLLDLAEVVERLGGDR